MCDVFALDRSGKHDKASLVDILLDFLGSPSEEDLKQSKKSKASKQHGEKKKKAEEVDEESDDDAEDIKEGEMPTDKQLRRWVRAYARCFNPSKVTLKHAMSIVEEKFGVSLKEKKDRIKELLTEEI